MVLAVVPAANGQLPPIPPRHLPAQWRCPGLGQEVLKLIQLIRLAPPGASATIWLTQALQPPQGGQDQCNEQEYTALRVTPSSAGMTTQMLFQQIPENVNYSEMMKENSDVFEPLKHVYLDNF